MFVLGWPLLCVLLTLRMSACRLEILEHDSHDVVCSQGLYECTMEDENPLDPQNSVEVQTLKPDFKLCCKNKTACTLCLVIDMEFYIDPDEEAQGSSGSQEEYSEEKVNLKGSLTVCHHTGTLIPSCKKVEFTVNHAALIQQHQVKVSVVIADPGGFPFDSHLIVYIPPKNLTQNVVAPSFNEVCSQELQKIVQQCQAPKIRIAVTPEKNQVELKFEGSNKTLLMCVHYEEKGRCRSWDRMTIPLYSVTPCMCIQMWEKDNQMSLRSQQCPFNKIEKNVWENITVSGPREQETFDHGAMLLSWNVSAPCRLHGEVWLLYEDGLGGSTLRQPLAYGAAWKQNSKGLWVRSEIVDDGIYCHMRVNGMEHDLGPFCFDTGRESVICEEINIHVLVLSPDVHLTVFLLTFIDWVWSWQHGGIVKIGRRRHVVLLSPPDVDDGISELVYQLGSFLSNNGFSVSIDQQSRKEQCTWGPLPWLHSQLLELNSLGGRVLLVLTRKALERTEEWMHCNKDIIKGGMGKEEKDVPKLWPPYSDLFTASLFLIQADKLLRRAGERFLLITFDSHSTQTQTSNRSLPELLQGLPLFRLPSQTQSLLAEINIKETERGSRGMTWTSKKASSCKSFKSPACALITSITSVCT
uniref:SEFIR domain-containing protein n=1 Tax=Amphilophus citrinellus TaxID=61819 RepID=A0A3Q0SK83_AMPCI